MRTCRYHCRGCGRHFASLGAFDTHRVGKFDLPKHSLEGRRCKPTEADNRYMEVGGECRNASPQTLSKQRIWALVADRESCAKGLPMTGVEVVVAPEYAGTYIHSAPALHKQPGAWHRVKTHSPRRRPKAIDARCREPRKKEDAMPTTNHYRATL